MPHKALQQRMSLLLAFQTLVTGDAAMPAADMADRIVALAKHMSAFCDLHTQTTARIENEADTVNAAIERHAKELRQNGSTVLPESKQELCRLYEALRLRKVQRIDAMLFQETTTSKMADYVLSHIEEEIEYQEGLS